MMIQHFLITPNPWRTTLASVKLLCPVRSDFYVVYSVVNELHNNTLEAVFRSWYHSSATIFVAVFFPHLLQPCPINYSTNVTIYDLLYPNPVHRHPSLTLAPTGWRSFPATRNLAPEALRAGSPNPTCTTYNFPLNIERKMMKCIISCRWWEYFYYSEKLCDRAILSYLFSLIFTIKGCILHTYHNPS